MASIEKRGKSYRIVVSCGYDINNEQIKHKMTWKPDDGMTEKQVEKELNRQAVLFEEKCKKGLVIDSNIKLIDFEELYFRDHCKSLRVNTVAGYKLLTPRVNRALGHLHLDRIRPHHLLSFYDNLEEEGARLDMKYQCTVNLIGIIAKKKMSQIAFAKEAGVSISVLTSIRDHKNVTLPSAERISAALGKKMDSMFKSVSSNKKLSNNTILHYHRFLSSIFSAAVQWQVLSDNPCRHIKPPKVSKTNPAYYDDETALKMLSYIDSESMKYRMLIYLYVYMGYRRGEALGLKWTDINFEKSLIDTGHAVYYLPKKGVFVDETKNKTSQRVTKAPLIVMQMLKDYRIWQNEQRLRAGDQWIDEGFIFTKWNGQPMHPSSVTRWFHDFIIRNKLPYLNVKGLRHTNASLQIANGVPLTTVAKRLGHANTNTTTKVYAHAIQSADAAAAELIGDILKPAKNQ